MSSSPNIQFILYEVQAIGCINPPYQMLYGFLVNVFRHISLIQHLLQGISVWFKAEYQGYEGGPG